MRLKSSIRCETLLSLISPKTHPLPVLEQGFAFLFLKERSLRESLTYLSRSVSIHYFSEKKNMPKDNEKKDADLKIIDLSSSKEVITLKLPQKMAAKIQEDEVLRFKGVILE